MKKILASALLAGLLLGTTSTVFAASGDTSQNTVVTGNVNAEYEIIIPETLLVNLTSGSTESNNLAITLNDLTAAGSITVTPELPTLERTSGTAPLLGNEKVAIEMQDNLNAVITSFDLAGSSDAKTIQIVPTEDSRTKIADVYTGTINFNLNYSPADPADPAA